MTQGVIYIVDGDGLRRMTPSAPENENRMQELVARYPELITDGDGDLLLVRREHPVGDGESDSRWSLDHLFVTREGVPVLVELKRAVDTRLRREVVGQVLDYAANASIHWQAGTIARSFAKTAGPDAESALAAFLGDADQDAFWQQVDSNLRAGRLKLVFVADLIPRELAIIVEFLNTQMKADARAVELRWFTGGDGVTTLHPRIIGETEQTVAAKEARTLPHPQTIDQWIDENFTSKGPPYIEAVRTFVRLVVEAGGQPVLPATQGSIVAKFDVDDLKRPLYPFYLSRSGGGITLALGYLLNTPRFQSEEQRSILYNELTRIVGPLRTDNLSGFPSFPPQRLLESDVEAGIEKMLYEIRATAGHMAN